jgi:hypothetical protein
MSGQGLHLPKEGYRQVTPHMEEVKGIFRSWRSLRAHQRRGEQEKPT